MPDFTCDICNISTKSKYAYNNHLKTNKHKKNTMNDNTKSKKIIKDKGNANNEKSQKEKPKNGR